jgi:hypothetical protein
MKKVHAARRATLLIAGAAAALATLSSTARAQAGWPT